VALAVDPNDEEEESMGLGVGSLMKIGFSIVRSDNLIQI
jgi:hypothetical protein